MKKAKFLLPCLLAVAVLLICVFVLPTTAEAAADTVASGTCGDDLLWVLTSDGTLTISGNGEMTNYFPSFLPPWYDYKEKIVAVVLDYGVTNISSYAFYYCIELSEIEIPDSVTRLGHSAFCYCTNLTEIELPNSITSIGSDTFVHCASLNNIVIPNNISIIGSSVFQYCKGLANIVIPDSVTKIGLCAFEGCSNLNSINIPDSVTSIGESAFGKCSSLTGIWVDENNSNYCSDSHGVLFNKDKTELIQAPGGLTGSYIIPDSVTSIGSAFSGCRSLTSITIPDSLTTIDDYAFYGCASVTDVYYGGTETQWAEIAIGSCNESLTSATIHYGEEAETEIVTSGTCGNDLTWVLDSVGTLTISGTGLMDDYNVLWDIYPPWYEYRNDITAVVIEDGVISIGRFAFEGCAMTTITIPNGVVSIGNFAFEDCYNLTSVELPDSVTSIGRAAFINCSGLTSIHIPESVTVIESETFLGCTRLSSIEIPSSVSKIKYGAFSRCSSLTEIAIPASVTVIGEGVFGDCNSLTGIWVDESNTAYCSDEKGVLFNKDMTELIKAPATLSGSYTVANSVTTLAADAFYGCALEEVILPDTVSSIGSAVFNGCSSLTNITIPDGVTSIDEYAFYSCTSLTEISIPNSITNIGDYAFYYCDALEDVYYGGWESQWNSISISEGNYALLNAVIHYDDTALISGDFDGNLELSDADAIYLLRHTLFPETYPLTMDGDVNSDGTVNDADAIYLLRHTLFPDIYPLYPTKESE